MKSGSYYVLLVLALFSLNSYSVETPNQKQEQRDFEHNIALYKEMYSQGQNKYEAAISIARVMSWIREYDEAISWYEKAIILKPIDVTAYLESSRVLFWARRKTECIDSYKKTLSIKNEAWIKDEMEGVQHLFDGEIKSSLESYKTSIKRNENNQEALTMLGVLYSDLGFYNQSLFYLEKLVKLNPDNEYATSYLEKSKIRSRGYKIESGIQQWHARSSERLTYLDTVSPYLSVSKSFSDQISFQTRYSRGIKKYSEGNIDDNSATVALNYRRQMDFGLSGQFTYRQLEKSTKDRNSFFLGGYWNAFQTIRMDLSVKKENLINNYQAQKENINAVTLSEKIEKSFFKNNLTVFVCANQGNMSDDNKFSIFSAGGTIPLIDWEHQPYVMIAKEWMKYDRTSLFYYAPSNYNDFSTRLGLKKMESGNFKYDASIKMTRDSNTEMSWRPEIYFSYDVLARFILNGSVSKTKSNYYNDNAFELGLTYYL